jgi:hypothetical protein
MTAVPNNDNALVEITKKSMTTHQPIVSATSVPISGARACLVNGAATNKLMASQVKSWTKRIYHPFASVGRRGRSEIPSDEPGNWERGGYSKSM